MSTEMQMMLSNLPPADCARLHAFVRVGSDRLRKRWSIGTDGPVGLLLFSGDAPPTIPGLLDSTPRLVRVVDGGMAASDGVPVLSRPIDFEAVICLMLTAEGAPSPAAPAPAAGPAAPAQAASEPPVVPAAGRAPPAGPTVPNLATPDVGGPVRLRRWPPAQLLQEWRYGVRMASFMSTRFVTVAELARLSNVSESECARFVEALSAAAMLRRLAEVAPASRAAAPPPSTESAAKAGAVSQVALASEPAAAAQARSARLGLLGRLRQKLGLGQPGS